MAGRPAEPHASGDPALLLGLSSNAWPDLIAAVEAGLPWRVFERLSAQMMLSSEDLRTLVGVPARTLARRKREGRFPPDESDRLVRVSRLFGAALRLFEEDRAAAARWLSDPQAGLGGEVPLRLARTEVGALEVERLLGRLEHGVFV
jgi:putative toxin-antitoxin system antitoxin component (TIGR02293 family)